MPTMDSLPPFARAYLEGMTFDGVIAEPLHSCRKLPEKWQRTSAPDGQRPSKLYRVNCAVDSGYPFYYYEALLNTSISLEISVTIGLVSEQKRKSQGDEFLAKTQIKLVSNVKHAVEPGPVSDDSLVLRVEAGDTVGCGIHRAESAIFWTRNGTMIGGLRFVHGLKDSAILPAVCVERQLVEAADTALFASQVVTNFGQQAFAFDIGRLTNNYFEPRTRLFLKSARSLPNEMRDLIAVNVAEHAQEWFDTTTLSRLCMVCRTWSKICRPLMFEGLTITSTTQVRRLSGILPLVKLQHRPRTLDIGGTVTRQVEPPTLGLIVSTLGAHLQRTTRTSWYVAQASDCEEPDVARPAPPRVENAVCALLRPLQSLTSLTIGRISFPVLGHLLRITRGVPRIQYLCLFEITVEKPSERVFWPASFALTELREFEVWDCTVPAQSIPALVSMGLRGAPNSLPLDDILSRQTRHLGQIELQQDHARLAQQVAHFVDDMQRFNAAAIEHECKLRFACPPGTDFMTATGAGWSLSVRLKKTSDSQDLLHHIETVKLVVGTGGKTYSD